MKVRTNLGLIIAITLLSALTPAQASTSKLNQPCSRLGKISSQYQTKYICEKVASKLRWQIFKSQSAMDRTPPNLSSNPLSTNHQNPQAPLLPQSATEPSSTSYPELPIFINTSPDPLTKPAPGRYCLDPYFRTSFNTNEVLICLNGLWTRQLGVRVTPNSPQVSPTPKKANLNSEKEIEQSLLNQWSTWKKNKKIDQYPNLEVAVQPGYSSDWEEITRSTINYTSSILNANGLKLVQTLRWVYTESEEGRLNEYNNFMKSSSCHPPYLPNSATFITMYCATADIGSGGVRIDKANLSMASGYKLTPRDKTVLTYAVAHDLAIFYIVQAQYKSTAYTGSLAQIPAWIREGTAQLIATLVTNDLVNNSSSYVSLPTQSQWVGPKPAQPCAKDLQDAEGREKIMPDHCSQAMHLYAVSLLAANHGGITALFDFFRLYGDNTDWVSNFQTVFGTSRQDFYKEWWSYLNLPTNLWPEILPPTPAEYY